MVPASKPDVVTDEQRRHLLAHRHRLTPTRRTDDVAKIADDVIALHSSDPASVFLAAAVRMANPSISEIERTVYDRRQLVRHHAMRRTIWVMTTAVAAVAHASSGRKVAAAERRRLVKRIADSLEVDDPEQWLDDALTEMIDLVAADGPIMTRDLGDRLHHLRQPLAYPAARGSTVDIVAHTKVIQLAGFEGRVVRTRPQGSWIGSQYAWTSMEDWVPAGIDHLDTHTAQADLAQRWLERFGPGTTVDLSWWTGWTNTDVKRALETIGARRVELESGETGWISAAHEPAPRPEPWVALLPGLDPTPMGWKTRAWYLSDELAPRVIDRNGNIGPTIWADGEVVGGWVQRPDGELATELPKPLAAHHQRMLADEIDRIRELVGDTRVRVRFPSPNQRDLLAP